MSVCNCKTAKASRRLFGSFQEGLKLLPACFVLTAGCLMEFHAQNDSKEDVRCTPSIYVFVSNWMIKLLIFINRRSCFGCYISTEVRFINTIIQMSPSFWTPGTVPLRKIFPHTRGGVVLNTACILRVELCLFGRPACWRAVDQCLTPAIILEDVLGAKILMTETSFHILYLL